MKSSHNSANALVPFFVVTASFAASCLVSRYADAQDDSRSLRNLLPRSNTSGLVLRFPGLESLTKPKAGWSGNGTVEMVYRRLPHGPGCYQMEFRKEGYLMMASGGSLRLKPNRNYRLSILLNCSFDRPAEINAGLWTTNGEQPSLFVLRGIPNRTGGWQRFERDLTSDVRPGGITRFYFRPFDVPKDGVFQIADIALIELPPVTREPFAHGEGATFRGGPGNLPMRVESVESHDDAIQVQTTGSQYQFDLKAGTISARQRLVNSRAVATWQPPFPLTDLRVLQDTKKQCVLGNKFVTFGVQCDSMLFIVPHRPGRWTLTSQISGKWNRLVHGHLLALDGKGGFSLNPDIPLGSGRLAEPEVLTKDLDFVDIPVDRFGNTQFLSKAQPGWQIGWQIQPGDRLAFGICPPRPFPWRESFDRGWALTWQGVRHHFYDTWTPYIDTVVLWDFFQRSWGMSWGPDFVPNDPEKLRSHIEAIKRRGMHPVPYMSMYFYYSRDPEEFIAAVRTAKDEYGIEGLYSDGNPSQEWIVAYEEIRMLRELFPDGRIILHTTGQPENGGPPMAQPDIFIPAIDTYATMTYRGEWVPYEGGADWPYPRYVSSQYGAANCLGIQKGDRWKGLSQLEQDLINLLYNGRASHWVGPDVLNVPAYYRNVYHPILKRLHQLWLDKGDQPDFYEDHYLPLAKELVERELKSTAE